ncbi:MAG: RNA polymerase sigma factor [Prevotella sp.]|nr:RNA polymerase sigma factor [Prevotella sp.]
MSKSTNINHLEQLIDEWQDSLYSLAFFRLGDEGAAQDVVQEAFIRYYRENQRTTIANAKSWLYRTTLNLTIDHLRRRPPIRAVPLSTALDKMDDEQRDLHEEYRRLEDLLTPLPDDQATVVRLHFTDDLSFSEIADILNISRDTVKSRYRYAMQKLRIIFNKRE